MFQKNIENQILKSQKEKEYNIMMKVTKVNHIQKSVGDLSDQRKGEYYMKMKLMEFHMNLIHQLKMKNKRRTIFIKVKNQNN